MMDQSFAETSTSTTPDCFLAVATSSGSFTVTIDAIASPENAIKRAPSLCKNRASDGANLANCSRVASPSTTKVFEHPDSIAANTHAFDLVSIQNVFFFFPSSSSFVALRKADDDDDDAATWLRRRKRKRKRRREGRRETAGVDQEEDASKPRGTTVVVLKVIAKFSKWGA
jgi:hypothetical protein